MALPKIEYPTYTVKLLSKKEPVRFRPFLVKEQKLLMMGAESKSQETVIETLLQIANNCILDDTDVTKLPMVDLEFLFLHMRARSVSESIDVFFKCKNIVEEKECGMVIDMAVDLLKEVNIVNESNTNKIMLTDKVGVMMRYPSINQLNISAEQTSKEIEMQLVVDCIDKIFDENSVVDAASADISELNEFVENLSNLDYGKLLEYTKFVPTIQYTNKQECPRCGFVHNVKLEGINDFFI